MGQATPHSLRSHGDIASWQARSPRQAMGAGLGLERQSLSCLKCKALQLLLLRGA